jgi:hypothetical protein
VQSAGVIWKPLVGRLVLLAADSAALPWPEGSAAAEAAGGSSSVSVISRQWLLHPAGGDEAYQGDCCGGFVACRTIACTSTKRRA